MSFSKGFGYRTCAIRIVGATALAALTAACTLVSIEGDGNSVSDVGGHGGGLTVPQTTDNDDGNVSGVSQRRPR